MHRHTIRTAGRIIAPRLNDEPFTGTFDEALAAMVTYAAEMRDHHGADAVRSRLTNALVNSQADRVAEITAGALLKLAEQLKAAPGPSPLPLAINDDVLVNDMPACVVAVPAAGEYLFQTSDGSLFSLTPDETATRVRAQAVPE